MVACPAWWGGPRTPPPSAGPPRATSTGRGRAPGAPPVGPHPRGARGAPRDAAPADQVPPLHVVDDLRRSLLRDAQQRGQVAHGHRAAVQGAQDEPVRPAEIREALCRQVRPEVGDEVLERDGEQDPEVWLDC